MEGFKGRKFLPASRSEAPPPRALGAEAEAEKFSFPFRRKKSGGRKIKEQRKFFCEACRRHRRRAAGRSEWIFSGIFDKVSSSEIINILQNLTFRFLTSHFVGGAQRRPLILGVSARFVRGQAEVRNPLRF